MRCLLIQLYRRQKHVALSVITAGIVCLLVLRAGLYCAIVSAIGGIASSAKSVDDVRLLKMVTPSTGEYLLVNPGRADFSRGQSRIIDNLLGEQENGFFVDVGAGDGEMNSVSLYFERERKWRGVLVEANSTRHLHSIAKNRKSLMWNLRIKVGHQAPPIEDDSITPQQLFQMINKTRIDLLIINIKGFEFDFIKDINFDKYFIRAITIELTSDISRDNYLAIANFLTSHGYTVAHHVVTSYINKKDVIFIKS